MVRNFTQEFCHNMRMPNLLCNNNCVVDSPLDKADVREVSNECKLIFRRSA